MIITGKNVLLYIEPKNCKSEPIIDELTIKMFNAIKEAIDEDHIGTLNSKNRFTIGIMTMGHHQCVCGAISSGADYLLNNGLITNYLCVHYVAYHRDEISEEELDKVKNLQSSNILNDSDKLKFILQ
jgi:hypothetical protein